MKLAVYGPDPRKSGPLAAFADARGFEAWPFDLAQDFCTFLFRDPESAGVLVADNHLDACNTIVEWRLAGLGAPLLVLLADRRPAPTDLARIIMAGADDAQHLSAEPEEIAARMTAISRRRWAAEAAMPASNADRILRELARDAAERSTPIIFPQRLRA